MVRSSKWAVRLVGRQARRRIEGKVGYAPDFAAVVHNVDRKLASFMEVSGVGRRVAMVNTGAGG